MGKYIFDIPIYRCSINKHTAELENDKRKHLQSLVDIHGPEVKKSQSYKWWGDYFDREKWYPWRYNEIVGWIRIYLLGRQIRGELWFISSKVIRKGLKNKAYYYRGKEFELTVFQTMSSADIYQMLLDQLEILKDCWSKKKRFLDTELLEEIGPFLDWHNFLDFGRN